MSEIITETIVSPDVTISKTCLFDVEFARQLVDNQSIVKEDRDKIRRILKECKRGNEIDTLYKLGKYCKHEFLGRWCALRGFGLQNMPRDIRSALSQKYYIDVDIVNAQPTLLVQYCESRGWACDSLKKYVANREELLKPMCDMMGIQRWEAKERVVSILFGGGASGMPEFFQNELQPEVRKIIANVYKEHESSLKWLKNRPNYMGKAISYILQTEERSCLEALDRALAKRGRSLDVYIHDGGLVRKQGDETTLPDAFLRELEKDILADTKYSIKLAIKPIETSFVLSYKKNDEEYLKMKQDFEQEYMKLMNPAVYIRVQNDVVQTITHKELIHQKQNLFLSDESQFINQWIKDPNIRTYERLAYAPKQEVGEDEYNLFTKFAIDPQPVVDISPILTLTSLVCNHEQKVIEYVLNCMAHMIQKPYQKLLICLIFQGLEGIGKDTWFDKIIGRILGEGYYFSTKSPENNVFHNFNAGTERCILVKFEEADFKTNKQNANKLKAVITQQRETYTRKGHDGVELNDYRNFVMTTNHEVPIVMDEGDNRRFVMIKCSDDKKGDSVFWNEMYKQLDNTDMLAQFHQFLLDRDISNFDSRDRVITEYYKDTKQALAPYHAKFFQDYFHKRDMLEDLEMVNAPNIEFKAYNLFNLMKESLASKFELNLKRFGTDMKPYVEAKCILKKETKTGAVYIVYPELCKEFMKTKDWFVEI